MYNKNLIIQEYKCILYDDSMIKNHSWPSSIKHNIWYTVKPV